MCSSEKRNGVLCIADLPNTFHDPPWLLLGYRRAAGEPLCMKVTVATKSIILHMQSRNFVTGQHSPVLFIMHPPARIVYEGG